MSQLDVLTDLAKGRPVYLTLNNFAVAKITMITVDEPGEVSLFEVLTTSPDMARQGIEELKFIYKKLLKKQLKPGKTEKISVYYCYQADFQI